MADKLKMAKRRFAFFNDHARAHAAVNAIILAQELNVPLRSLPSEAMVAQFLALAKR